MVVGSVCPTSSSFFFFHTLNLYSSQEEKNVLKKLLHFVTKCWTLVLLKMPFSVPLPYCWFQFVQLFSPSLFMEDQWFGSLCLYMPSLHPLVVIQSAYYRLLSLLHTSWIHWVSWDILFLIFFKAYLLLVENMWIFDILATAELGGKSKMYPCSAHWGLSFGLLYI